MSANFIPTEYNIYQNTQTIYDTATVLSNTETDVLTYTVPVGRKAVITTGAGEANTDTIFRLYVSTEIKGKQRNNWTERNIRFNITQLIPSGATIRITAEHKNIVAQEISASIIIVLF